MQEELRLLSIGELGRVKLQPMSEEPQMGSDEKHDCSATTDGGAASSDMDSALVNPPQPGVSAIGEVSTRPGQVDSLVMELVSEMRDLRLQVERLASARLVPAMSSTSNLSLSPPSQVLVSFPVPHSAKTQLAAELSAERIMRHDAAVLQRGKRRLDLNIHEYSSAIDAYAVLQGADIAYELLGVTDAELFGYLYTATKSNTALWRAIQANSVSTYPEWRRIFFSLTRPNEMAVLFRQALSMKQEHGQSILDFIAKKGEVLSRASVFDERMVIECTLNGMDLAYATEIRRMMGSTPVTSVSSLLSLAIRAEDIVLTNQKKPLESILGPRSQELLSAYPVRNQTTIVVPSSPEERRLHTMVQEVVEQELSAFSQAPVFRNPMDQGLSGAPSL